MSLKQDLKKLKAYAQSLGVGVNIKSKLPEGDAGYFYYDRKAPVIEIVKDDETQTILNLLHELGHALDWVQNSRRVKAEEYKVLDKDPLSENERKILYEHENRAITNMHAIWKTLALSIPEYKVLAEQRVDRWQYMNYVYFGSFPRKAQRRKQRIVFRKKVQEEMKKEAWKRRYFGLSTKIADANK